MNTPLPTPPKLSRFPFFRRCARGIFGRKMVYVIVAGLTLLALSYAVENFRGARAWRDLQQDAAARGLKLDFSSHIPPAIPDEENAANTPWIQSWFPNPVPNDPAWPSLKFDAERKISNPKRDGRRHLTDLVAWKEALELTSAGERVAEKINSKPREQGERAAAAQAVLGFLKEYQPALDELRLASAKPRVRYPVEYKLDEPFSILLPHLTRIRGIVSLLTLQGSAKLAAGQTNSAFQDVQLMFWLTDSLRDEPFLISQLVRRSCLQIIAHTIWEGLAEHRWSDAQLLDFQNRLLRFNFLQSLRAALETERAGSIAAIESMRRRTSLAHFMAIDGDSSASSFSGMPNVLPSGWFRLETVNYCKALDLQIHNAVDYERGVIHSSRMEENEKQFTQFMTGRLPAVLRHRVFAQLILPALQNAARNVAIGQVTVHEAALACALERYQLANGKLPESLSALSPQYLTKLPHDTLTGEPLSYERLNDTDFVLSSVGWPSNVGPGVKTLRDEKLGTVEGTSSQRDAKRVEWTWISAP